MDVHEKDIIARRRTKALRTLTDCNHILAASLRNNLSTGVLRFRSDTLLFSSSKSKSSTEQLLLSNPNPVEIFRKILGGR